MSSCAIKKIDAVKHCNATAGTV